VIRDAPSNAVGDTRDSRPGVLQMLTAARGIACAAMLAAAVATAQSPADEALDARLKVLELQLRCLVCQNQTLADSDAPLAADLRREVRELAVAGKSDDDIRRFLTARYGDFVLYDPPVQRNTWLLWFGPFALLLTGALVWWRMARRRTSRSPPVDAAEADAAARGRSLLDT
jgi:cytochrome c-type biogenesis protein CcmH